MGTRYWEQDDPDGDEPLRLWRRSDTDGASPGDAYVSAEVDYEWSAAPDGALADLLRQESDSLHEVTEPEVERVLAAWAQG